LVVLAALPKCARLAATRGPPAPADAELVGAGVPILMPGLGMVVWTKELVYDAQLGEAGMRVVIGPWSSGSWVWVLTWALTIRRWRSPGY
jgi:hypothetical protein